MTDEKSISKIADMKVGRRGFLTGASVAAGAALAAPFVGGIAPARAADRTKITFASAKFFGKETMAQMVDAYNQSQSKVLVDYQELPPPSSSTQVHQMLVQRLAQKNGTPDVFTQDIVWIAEFAGAGWALNLDQYIGKDERANYFPGVMKACTWGGHLTALPWYLDAGMLYYRTDLLKDIGAKVPETWQDLVDAAQKLQKENKVKFGFLWQGKQAEVLVCDLVEFVASNGGSILGPDGQTVKIADKPAVEAVQFMRDTIDKYHISPDAVLSADEEPSRRPFTGGDAAFLRNWSYVWTIAQDPQQSEVAGKVGVAPLPHFPGHNSAACLGGYQYGVNAATKHREEAIDFLKWMSSPDTQLKFATQLGLAPSRPSVYKQDALQKAQPFMAKLQDIFVNATPRPVTPKYSQVTLALQSAVSRALANGNVQQNLDEAKQKLEKIVS